MYLPVFDQINDSKSLLASGTGYTYKEVGGGDEFHDETRELVSFSTSSKFEHIISLVVNGSIMLEGTADVWRMCIYLYSINDNQQHLYLSIMIARLEAPSVATFYES